jgi:predicted nucleic acid-binding protein
MPDLLDTNILSELRKPRPAFEVVSYFAQRASVELFISVVNVAEVRFGISVAKDPAKVKDLAEWLNSTLLSLFNGRIMPVNEAILLRWRILLETGRKAGRIFPQPDLFLAATALEHDPTLVTRNTSDFAGMDGLKLLNPWEHRS